MSDYNAAQLLKKYIEMERSNGKFRMLYVLLSYSTIVLCTLADKSSGRGAYYKAALCCTIVLGDGHGHENQLHYSSLVSTCDNWSLLAAELFDANFTLWYMDFRQIVINGIFGNRPWIKLFTESRSRFESTNCFKLTIQKWLLLYIVDLRQANAESDLTENWWVQPLQNPADAINME